MYIVTGKKVMIRNMEFDDLPFFLKLRNQCRESLHDNYEFSLRECISWWDKNDPQFYLIENFDGLPVGYVRTSHWVQHTRSVYMGIDIHPTYRRMGYATEGYELMLHYFFAARNMNKVALEVLATNAPAMALYHKLGFKEDGVKRAEILRDDEFIDSILMSILVDEWKGNESSQS